MSMIAPQGWKVGPAGVRKRRKANAKKRRNTAPGFKALDPYFFGVQGHHIPYTASLKIHTQ